MASTQSRSNMAAIASWPGNSQNTTLATTHTAIAHAVTRNSLHAIRLAIFSIPSLQMLIKDTAITAGADASHCNFTLNLQRASMEMAEEEGFEPPRAFRL